MIYPNPVGSISNIFDISQLDERYDEFYGFDRCDTLDLVSQLMFDPHHKEMSPKDVLKKRIIL